MLRGSSNICQYITIALAAIVLTTVNNVEAKHASSGYVNVDNDVYFFIDKSVIKGYIGIENSLHRPMTMKRIVNLLEDIKLQAELQQDKMSLNEVQFYLREFAIEVNAESRESNWRLYQRYDEDLSVVIDPLFWVEMTANDDESIMRRATGLSFHGNLKRKVGFSFYFIDNVERGGGPYTERSQLIYPYPGYVAPLNSVEETYFDLSSAVVNWDFYMFEFAFGRDKVNWGAGKHHHLLVGSNVPEYNHFRFKADITKFISFHYILGALSPNEAPVRVVYTTPREWTRVQVVEKWIAAHRLEVKPFDWFAVGFSEAIIWGERDLQLAYLNPLNFYFSAEHDLRDQDNVALAMDFIFKTPYNTVLNGEILIDDFSLSNVGKDSPTNRTGYKLAIQTYDLFMGRLYTNLQYTKIRPFVYSHFYPVNTWSHWYNSMGASLKPNSDEFRLDLNFALRRDLKVNASAVNTRNGSIGSNIGESIPKSSFESPFLGDTRNDNFAYALGMKWEYKPGLTTEAGFIKNADSQRMSDRYYLSLGYRYNLSLGI